MATDFSGTAPFQGRSRAETPSNKLLSALQGVRKRAAGEWEARCPAHDDKNPSLSISEVDDGRVLIHCHAGCPNSAVVEALGLELRDLFPQGAISDHKTGFQAPRRNLWDLFKEVSYSLTVITLADSKLRQGKPLDADERKELDKALKNINAFHKEAA